jgi:predicted O-methyltransferase YrrM
MLTSGCMTGNGFFDKVKPLLVPEMGTESTAPLLYWLIRAVRPRSVLEVGMGYTTPFLAQALRDNMDSIEVERSMLTDPASEPFRPLAFPDYYDQPYQPKLVCVDRMADPASSAPRALGILAELELTDLVEVIEGDLRGSSGKVRDRLGLIDFGWIDTWDTIAFLREYWSLINPAGGFLAVHYLMTYPQGRAIQHYINSLKGPEGGRLEVTNFLEPHKTYQNSTTLIRRIRDFQEPVDLRPFGTANDPVGVFET